MLTGKSKNWLKRHVKDIYVSKSHKNNLRSRAYFKIKSLQEKFNFINKNSFVLELGSAPGGWSQYVSSIVKHGSGKIIACDLLEMDPLSGVDFVRGDFTDDNVFKSLLGYSSKKKFDVILSDMSPNLTGNASIDIPRSINLAELGFDMCVQSLACKGAFVVKLFQGSGFDDYLSLLRDNFKSVTIEKPDSSRASSREVYIVARFYNF